VTSDDDSDQIVTVLPITHTPPSNPDLAVEIPHATKRRLGLDDDRSWIVLTEANRFIWPGPDLRFARTGDPASVSYGLLPRDLFKEVTRNCLTLLRHVLSVLCLELSEINTLPRLFVMGKQLIRDMPW
jgi:hypothetical protein